MTALKKFYAWVCRVELTIAMINLCVSTGLIFVSAIMRYLRMPINWSLEISLFLFAWCVFLSADVSLREDRLVRLDMLTSRLPKRVEHFLSLLSYSIIILFLFAMVYYGFILSWKTRVRTFLGIPNFSYTWVTLSLPVAALLMIVSTSIKLHGFYRLFRDPDAPPPEKIGRTDASEPPFCENVPPA